MTNTTSDCAPEHLRASSRHATLAELRGQIDARIARIEKRTGEAAER
jgi:hypothetical protein